MATRTVILGNNKDLFDSTTDNLNVLADSSKHTITVGNGSDTIVSGNGVNIINAGDGNDSIFVGNGGSIATGVNQINVGNGNDIIIAGNGDNLITAKNGKDTISVGKGHNTIQVGSGNDTISIYNGSGSAVGTDAITIAGSATVTSTDSITAGDESISLTVTGKANVTMQAGNGNSTINLSGGSGVENITLGNGTNTISMGSNDTLLAGAGKNVVTFGTGSNDKVTLGNGNNTVTLGTGSNNTVNLGTGQNIIDGGAGSTTTVTGKGSYTYEEEQNALNLSATGRTTYNGTGSTLTIKMSAGELNAFNATDLNALNTYLAHPGTASFAFNSMPLTIKGFTSVVETKVNLGGPSSPALASTTVKEHATAGTIIGTLTTSDPNVLDTITWTLSGVNASDFSVVNIPAAPNAKGITTSQAYLQLSAAGTLHNVTGTEAVTVTAKDLEGNTIAQNFNVLIAPTAPGSITYTYIDAAGASLAIPLPSQQTSNAGDHFSYALVSAPVDASNFSLNPLTGAVSYTSNAAFAGTDHFSYQVTDFSADNTTSTVSAVITANIDVVGAPVVTFANGPFVDQENTSISLSGDILAMLPPGEPSGTTLSSITISGVPAGASFNQGSHNLNGDVWTFTSAQLVGLMLTPPTNFDGTVHLSVTATATENGVSSTSAAQALNIAVFPIAPSVSNGALIDPEDQALSANLPTYTSVNLNSGHDVFTYSVGSALHGTVVVTDATQGAFTYTPNSHFAGTDTFSFTVTDTNSDGQSNSSTAIETILIKPTAPVVPNGTQIDPEDQALSNIPFVYTSVNSANPNDSFSYSGGAALHGTAVVNANGTFNYSPNLYFAGTDIFSFTITDTNSDGQSTSTTATETILIKPTAPGVSNGSLIDPENQALNGALPVYTSINSANPNDSFSYSGGAAAHGTVVVNPNGTFTYTPGANFAGTDSFSFTVTDTNSDGQSNSVTATETILIKPTAPANLAISFSVTEDISSYNGILDAMSPNIGKDSFSYTINLQPAYGTITLLNNPSTGSESFTYMPNAGFFGTDSFSYTVIDTSPDGTTHSATETVSGNSITVTPLALILTPGVTSTPENSAAVILNSVSGYDANDALSFSFTQGANTLVANGGVYTTAGGSFTVSASGAVSYTPANGFSGTDSFNEQVTVFSNGGTAQQIGNETLSVVVTPVVSTILTPPVLDLLTSTVTIPANTFIALANDMDIILPAEPAGTTISFTISGVPQDASFNQGTNNHDGSWTFSDDQLTNLIFTPAASGGAFSLNVIATATNNGLTANSASQALGVNVIAPPNLTFADNTLTGQANSLIALGISALLPLGEPAGTTVTGITISNVPTDALFNHGTNNHDGTWSFTSNQLTGLVFVPTADDEGTLNLNVRATATDNGVTSTSIAKTLSIAVTLNYNDSENSPFNGTLPALGPTIEPNGTTDNLTYVLAASPDKGGSFAWFSPTRGVFFYQPTSNFTGTESFTYYVHNLTRGTISNVATADMLVAPTAPDHTTQNFATAENIAISNIQLPSQETSNNPNERPPIYHLATQAAHGIVSLDSTTGIFSYTPITNFSGADSFTYTVTDTAQDGTVSTTSAATAVNIAVSPNAPTPNRPDNVTQHYTDLTGSTLSTAVPTQEPSGGNNTNAHFLYNLGTLPAEGTLSWNSNTGAFTYTPHANFAGDDQFTYTVTAIASDGNTQVTSNTTTASIQVMRSEIENTASNPTSLTNVPLPQLPLVTNNPGDTFSYALLGSATTAHGGVTVNNNGTFSYTPNTNFTGEDSFTYTVTDTTKATSVSATYYIGVAPSMPGSTNPLPYNASEGQQTGLFHLDPEQMSNAGDSFTYTLTGGNVQTFPNSSAERETLVDGILTFFPTSGSFYYTPTNLTFTGTEHFTYTVTDHSADGKTSTTSTVTTASIAVAPATPGFNDVNYTDAENTTFSNHLPSQERSGNSNDTFTYTLTSGSVAGLIFNSNGTFSFTPNTGFVGNNTFTYTVTDHSADGTTSSTSNNVTAHIAVAPSAPGHAAQSSFIMPSEELTGMLATQSTSGDLSSTFNFQLILGSGDIDLSPAGSPVYAMQTPHGVVSLVGGSSNTGHITYIPTYGFTGTDSFSYITTETSHGVSSTSAVTTENINVNYSLYVMTSNDNTHTSGISMISENMVTTAALNQAGNPIDPNGGYHFTESSTPVGVNLGAGTHFIAEALDPDTGNVYVLNSTDNIATDTVSVIHTSGVQATVGLQATIQVGNNPSDIIFNPANHDFYVYNVADGSVSVIDPLSNTVITTIAHVAGTTTFNGSLSSEPNSMAVNPFNGNTFVVQDAPVFLPAPQGLQPIGVTVINSSNTIVTTLHHVPTNSLNGGVDTPQAIVFDPDNQYLYVAATYTNVTQFSGNIPGFEIDIYNTTNNAFVGSMSDGHIYGQGPSMVYDPINKQIDISVQGDPQRGLSGLFNAFSTATNSGIFPGGFPIQGINPIAMVYDPHNHDVYILDENGGAGGLTDAVRIFDGSAGHLLSTVIGVGSGSGISFDPLTNQIDVVGNFDFSGGNSPTSGSAVGIINDSTNTLVAVLPTVPDAIETISNFPTASLLNPTLTFSQVSNGTYNSVNLESSTYFTNPVSTITYQSDSTDSLTITYNSQTNTGSISDTHGHTDTISNFDVVYGSSQDNTFIFQALPNNETFGGPTGNNTADYSSLVIPTNDVLHIDLSADLAYVTANGSAIGIPDKLLNFNHVIGTNAILHGEVITVNSVANVVDGGTNLTNVIDLSALAGTIDLTANVPNTTHIADWTHIEGLELGQATALSINTTDVQNMSHNNQLTITAPTGNNDSVTATGGWTATGQQTLATDVTTGAMHTYDTYTAAGGSETLLIDHNITTLSIH